MQTVKAHDIRNHQNVSTSQPAFNVQEDEENSNDTTIEILQSDVEQPTNRETPVDDKNFVTRTAESKLTSFSLKTLIESSMDSEGSTTLSSQVDNDDDDDDEDEEVAMGVWQSTTTDDEKEDQGQICVPVGPATNDEECATRRWLSNQCPICLSPFELNDQITRAGNPACCHVFHYSCMTYCLSAAGRKHMARQEARADPTLMSTSDPQTAVKKFPMLCPCCRQDFVWNESKQEHQDDENEDEQQQENQNCSPSLYNSTNDTAHVEVDIHQPEENVQEVDAL